MPSRGGTKAPKPTGRRIRDTLLITAASRKSGLVTLGEVSGKRDVKQIAAEELVERGYAIWFDETTLMVTPRGLDPATLARAALRILQNGVVHPDLRPLSPERKPGK